MSMSKFNPVTIPAAALDGVARYIVQYGTHGVETGGFFVGNAADVVVHVAFAGEKGVLRRRDQFAVSGRAMDRLFTWAGDRQLYVPAQFHSHGGHHGQRPFLSLTDQLHGFRVDGFVSSVVPDFTEPPLQPQAWGWWQFRDGHWLEVPSASVSTGAISFVIFDEDGVRAA